MIPLAPVGSGTVVELVAVAAPWLDHVKALVPPARWVDDGLQVALAKVPPTVILLPASPVEAAVIVKNALPLV